MRFLRVLGIFLLFLAPCLSVMLLLGSRLPRAHVATATVVLAAPQARVWQTMEDTATQPQWRTGLVRIEPLPDQNGHHCWLEVQKQMRMPLCEDLTTAPSTRIVRIADPTLPFGGNWVYELTALDSNSSRLTITENGTTGPALWRFLGHYVFHEDTSIKQYESDLQRAVTK